MGKRISTRRIKKHRHYTYDDAADVIGVSAQTVRSWKPLGLSVLADGRPHYILGEALIEFIANRQQNGSVSLARDQVYCFACRAPRSPLGMMVDYVPINDARGCLVAFCEVCEGRCQRFGSEASLAALDEIFAIVRRSASQA